MVIGMVYLYVIFGDNFWLMVIVGELYDVYLVVNNRGEF